MREAWWTATAHEPASATRIGKPCPEAETYAALSHSATAIKRDAIHTDPVTQIRNQHTMADKPIGLPHHSKERQKSQVDMAKVYIDEDTGKDEPGVAGRETDPYKSLQFAFVATEGKGSYLTRKSQTGEVPEGKDESARLEWTPATKSALKKADTALKNHFKKLTKEKEQAAKREKEEADRQKQLEEAKKVVVKEDESLPKARKIRLDQVDSTIKLRKGTSEQDVNLKSEDYGTRVRVLGRVHQLRKQKDVFFIELKDGYGKMQVLLTGDLAKTYDALTLTRETSMEIFGELWEVPPGFHAPLDRELHADFFRIHPHWKAAGGDDAITNRVSAKTAPNILLDLRHLTLRGDESSSVMLVRDAVEFAFNITYKELSFRKVSPPALVQTQVEGGSTLFSFDYYGQPAYLTQSSQLYLETCLASLGNVYCIEKSFRAEKSLTRRHLSEYTHIEAELDFVTFDDLLDHLELVMCTVLEKTLADPVIKATILKLNPNFKMLERPFKRMKYAEAIEWLNEHNILTDDGKPHEFGDDIAEAAERHMTDTIDRVIFLTHFPAPIKSFYMQKDPNDRRVTESVDCLMPGVGEIVGGSMRMDDYQELIEAYARDPKEPINPEPYYWYTDQRKYGSSPHGGYGLGLERFLAWLCGRHTIRECCLYPRFMGRCTP
jgi:asparaginyl-tRNA synthetase